MSNINSNVGLQTILNTNNVFDSADMSDVTINNLTITGTLDTTGVTSLLGLADGVSIESTAGTLSVKDSGISTVKIAPLAVTNAKIFDVAGNKITGTLYIDDVVEKTLSHGVIIQGTTLSGVGSVSTTSVSATDLSAPSVYTDLISPYATNSTQISIKSDVSSIYNETTSKTVILKTNPSQSSSVINITYPTVSGTLLTSGSLSGYLTETSTNYVYNKTFDDVSTFIANFSAPTTRASIRATNCPVGVDTNYYLPSTSQTLVGQSSSDTLTNKILDVNSNSCFIADSTDLTNRRIYSNLSSITTPRTVTYQNSNGTIAYLSDIPSVAGFITASSTDTFTNKSIVDDGTNLFINNSDNTKKAVLDCSSIPTSTTRTYKFPVLTLSSGTLVCEDNPVVLTNKSINTNSVSKYIQSDVFKSLAGTSYGFQDTAATVDQEIVTVLQTQTLQNKSLRSGSTTIQDSTDATKLIAFSAASISTGTTRTLTSPNASGTLVLNDNTATITNKTLVLPAGTTSSQPLTMTSGSTLTTPTNGTLEYNNTLFFTPAISSSRGYIECVSISTPGTSNFGLSNVNTQQDAMPGARNVFTTNGSVAYQVEFLYQIQTGTLAARTIGISLAGSSTTYTSISIFVTAFDAAVNTATTTQSTTYVTQATNTVVSASVTAAKTIIYGKGEIRVNAGGNIIPSLQFSASPGNTCLMMVGSYFKLGAMSGSSYTAVGSWS